MSINPKENKEKEKERILQMSKSRLNNVWKIEPSYIDSRNLINSRAAICRVSPQRVYLSPLQFNPK